MEIAKSLYVINSTDPEKKKKEPGLKWGYLLLYLNGCTLLKYKAKT